MPVSCQVAAEPVLAVRIGRRPRLGLPGFQAEPGQRFRLRKRGVPKLGEKGRGDLFVEARIFVPTVRDDRSRELLLEFARLNPHDPRKSGPAPSGAGS